MRQTKVIRLKMGVMGLNRRDDIWRSLSGCASYLNSAFTVCRLCRYFLSLGPVGHGLPTIHPHLHPSLSLARISCKHVFNIYPNKVAQNWCHCSTAHFTSHLMPLAPYHLPSGYKQQHYIRVTLQPHWLPTTPSSRIRIRYRKARGQGSGKTLKKRHLTRLWVDAIAE